MNKLKRKSFKERPIAVSEITNIFQDLRREGKHFDDFIPALIKSYMSDLPLAEYLDWDSEHIVQCEAAEDVLNAYFEANPYTDILGSVMNNLNQLGNQKGLAAFHTPESVSYCMAQMSLLDLNLDDHPDGFSLGECCAGTGSIILQGMRVVNEMFGQEGLDKLRINANDLDITAIRCCFYQILKTIEHGSEKRRIGEILITHGNALIDDLKPLFHISGVTDNGTPIPAVFGRK